jgi:glycerol-3-phosphate O-acyltransferase
LLRAGATLSPSLGAETREAALREALGRLAADGELSILPAPDGENIYSLDDRGRRALDYYKNNVIHYLVPSAIVALALLAEPEVEGPTMPLAVAKGHAQRLSRLLKHEFSFSAAAAFEKSFDDALGVLVAERIAARVQAPEGEDGVRVLAGGGVLARELAGQLAVFLEAYAVVAEVAERKLADRPTPEKELLAEALVVAQRQALEGRLRRSESASQATLQNAVKLLLDLGYLARADGGKLAAGATPIAELRAELTRYTRHLD